MAQVAITDRNGGVRAVASDTLGRLEAGLDGRLVYPGDPEFADVTRIWNGMITKKPAVAVRAKSKGDVARTVDFARDNGLELSIRGGGHNIAGLALSDGGITLDMSGMDSVAVDPDSRTVRVDPGCTLGDIDRVTQEHGLATTLGFVSETGVAGLTLGGGFGYLTRQFGWTVDDLLEVEIVTADAGVLRASRTQNEDLFWALRGGGGNFGVVTEFVYRLHEIGPEVTAGLIAWPASEAEAVVDIYRTVTAAAPRELTAAVLRRNGPPAPWLPEQHHGTPIVAIVLCHTGDPSDAESDLAPIRSHAQPLADVIQRKPYAAQQSMLDASFPKGLHYYWKSEFLPGITDEVVAAYHAAFEDNSSPANQIVLFHLEGALNEHDDDDGAMGNREARYACVIQASWPEDSPVGAEYRDWVRSGWSELRPYSTGGNYVNFQTEDEDDDRTQASYGGNYARLEEVKAAYDAANLFRVNRNISPNVSRG